VYESPRPTPLQVRFFRSVTWVTIFRFDASSPAAKIGGP
jgi:hypothetical protein